MRAETLEVIKLVEHIRICEAEIEGWQEQKKKAEDRLDELVSARNPSSNVTAAPVSTTRRGRIASETSAKKLISNLLDTNPDTDFDAVTVAGRLSMNLGTARTNLSKLTTRGYIEKRSANTYGAKREQEKEAPEETS